VGHKKTADALGIGDDFSLRVRYKDGTEEYVRSGEVSIRARGGGYTSA
jgi:flagellar basal body rod protein FlgF